MLLPDGAQVESWRRLRELVLASTPEVQGRLLKDAADGSRRSVLRMIRAAGIGHVGGDLSVLDILTCLYTAVLRVDPLNPQLADRDRLILSKGHCAGALYATLAAAGFFPISTLDLFMAPLSPLNGHPDRNETPGIETNTGALGHGLPVAVGSAIAGKLAASQRRIFVVLGDGELQEGSNWEAIMTASHRGLDNLVAIVDRNGLQQGAATEGTNQLEPLTDKWRSFGWHTLTVDGHNHVELLNALTARNDKPTCVIAKTVKGKGVSFMEGRVEWHHKVPSQEEFELALAELGR